MNRWLVRTVAMSTVVLVVAACQPAPPPDHAATLGPAQRQFIGMWNTKDYAVLDTVLAPDFKRVAPDQKVSGLDEMKIFVQQVHTAYPDFHIETPHVAFSPNRAWARWTATGTNTGAGATEPTGKAITLEGVTLLTFRDGKIIEEDVFFDSAVFSEELGTTVMPHQAALKQPMNQEAD